MYIIGFSVLICLILVFMLFYILNYNKDMLRQKSQMEDMVKTIDNLNHKLSETNNRKTYRITIPITECEFEFMELGSHGDVSMLNKKGVANIRDISLTGLRFECNYDFSVREKIIIKMSFVLRDEPLVVIGRVLRKEEHFGKPMISYGMEFMKTHVSREEELFRVLREIEVESRKKGTK